MEKPSNSDAGQEGHSARQQLEAKLLGAVDRGAYRKVTPEFWVRLETIAHGKLARKRKPGQS